MEELAHSQNNEGYKHSLISHLQAVAALTAKYAAKYGAGDLGKWVGLWHDLGKFNPAFQRYIHNPSPAHGPDHSSAGAIFAANYHNLLAFPVAGHHGGLPNKPDLKARLQRKKDDPTVSAALSRAREIMNSIVTPDSLLSIPQFPKSKLQVELFIRMLFSCLVDADFLDTEAYLAGNKADARNVEPPSLTELWLRFQANHISGVKHDRLNQFRHEIYRHCLEAANMPQGIFRLTVPTGGGKTLSGMAFALKHALAYDLERIIIAIPYTSIIDQTAEAYRNTLGNESILEHHSGVNWDDNSECPDKWQLRARLASENWDASIVVTTTVQLFESLFANRPSRCRKLHNIARSVLILDEVQILPERLLEPCLNVLKELATNYHVTVVLCSATQPALEKGPYIAGFTDIRDIVPNSQWYFSALKRVNYQLPMVNEEWDWTRVADEMRRSEQSMAVLNTRKDALSLLNTLDEPDALHLSTLLCGAHRRAVISEVHRRLTNGEPCHLVTTQIVEAGVDIDFPVVLRAVGPLDRIVQSAGRCNREGHMDKGRVIIYVPLEGSLPPGAYRTGTDIAMELLTQKNIDLHDPDIYRRYFQRLYQAVETDREEIQKKRESFMFQEVAERFHIIEDDTVPAVVRYRSADNPSSVDSLLATVSHDTENPRWLIRRLQPYIVNIREHQVTNLQQEGLLDEILPGLYEWKGGYDKVRGVVQRNLNPEDLIV
ncbi:MAG: CRISPR-associated helicase Cas3' [Dehalococcoidia bacterium]|nr:CRISPR-associated helicase Cas3' [Dehalococcoidia bacterium]